MTFELREVAATWRLGHVLLPDHSVVHRPWILLDADRHPHRIDADLLVTRNPLRALAPILRSEDSDHDGDLWRHRLVADGSTPAAYLGGPGIEVLVEPVRLEVVADDGWFVLFDLLSRGRIEGLQEHESVQASTVHDLRQARDRVPPGELWAVTNLTARLAAAGMNHGGRGRRGQDRDRA